MGDPVAVLLVVFHTEPAAETHALGLFLDGRDSLVVGTLTHIPTSGDLSRQSGTALMADAGMCGDYA